MAQVSYGTITITDTNDIESIVVEYARNQSTSSPPDPETGGWSTTRPAWAQGYYIWQRTRIHKSGTQASADTFGAAVCLTGSTGQTGNPGAAGRSLTGTETKYTNVASNTTQAQVEALAESNWINNVPSYNSSKPDYWVRIKNIYDKAPLTEYIYYKDNGIADAVKTSYDANTTAQAASDKADDAWDKADNAETLASNASSAISDLNQYFWRKKTASTNVPAGSYVTNIPGTTYESNPANGGFNSLVQATGIFLRNGITTLSSWTGTALTFYKPGTSNKGIELTASALKFYNPSTNNAQLIIGANGVLQSGNYVYTSGTYSDSGTKIDLTNGSIYTPGFRTDGSNTYIRGEINALTGKIGSNSSNYWTIGNYYNYDQTASAALISHGTAFIQLDTSNTWRLSTDRIHTAWNGTDGSAALVFPKDGNTYWDWGMHSPHKTNNTWKDKFIYARKYTNISDSDFTNRDNLSNDLDDDLGYWTYQFYVDKNGSIYARNFYLLNEDGTPGSNIGGQDAVYLLKSGGTISGNLEVNGTLTKGSKNVAYLSTTPTSGQVLVADGTAGGIKTSGYTIAKSVPSNAIFTDENVNTSQANTTQIYLTGTSTAGSSTGKLKFDSNVYLTTTAGTLHATTFEGNLSGTASRATADGDGNKISTTYLKLSGGNVTGAVTFGSSVSADELTAGDLVVNGAASFTNNLQANTINGVEVGASPKFTDTVTTVTTSGNGNAVTAITASNGKLTVTKGTTFLTSYTETDPIFVASAAHGITSSDISNWNSKTSNTGTVTSVRVQASSPLQSSVSTAQNASLNTTISFTNQNANTVLAGPASGSTAAAPTFRKLVAADIPDISGTYYLASNPNGYTTNVGTVTKVIAGTGLAIGTTAQGNFTTSGTINHTNSVTAKTAAAQSAKTLTFGDTFTLYEEKYDAQGHITGVASYNMTMPANPNTHYTANLITGASATAQANAAASTNGNVYLNLVENSTVRNSHNIVGSGTITVTSDANGKITISGSAHPTSLKNPNALAVKIYNGTSTSSNTNYDGSVANQSISVAGTNAITGINSTTDGKLQLTLADGSQPTPIAIKITATTSDSAASADKLNLSANVGSSTRPVYFDANTGLPVAIDYTIQSNVPQNAKFTDTWTAMVGATSSANGSVGYVNAVPPKDGYNTKFLRADGTWVVPGGTYSLPLAANGTRGGVQIGYTQSGKNYPVQLSSEKMYVNVPWTDTTYSAGTGLSLSGTTFSNSGVTGVKGNAESSYRTGQVNLTAANVQAIKISENGNTQQLARPLQLNGCNDNTLDAKINTLRANRLAFLPADQIIIEKTTDGGTTWTDAGVADSTKTGLFSETRPGVNIPLLNGVKNINCGLRITFTAMKYNVPSGTAETSKYNYWNSNYIASTERYNQLKEMYFWVSSNTDSIGVKVERATGAASTNWVTIFDNTNYGLTGWSGNDYIRFSQSVFGGGTTQTTNYWNYRLTFFTRGPGGSMTLSGTNTNSSQSISEIRGYGDTWWVAGNEYAANDHLYTHDYLKNAIFPAQITATQFNGSLSGNASSATKATNDVDGNPIKTTYAKLSGATFTGAINTANGTYNKIGDDVQIGDINVAGTLGIKGINGRTGIRFVAYSGSTNTDIYNDGAGNLTITGTVLSTFSGNLTGNVTGNVTGTASGNITSVQYDSTNTKFTYTKNGSNTDIVTIANLKTYLGLKALAYKDSLGKSDVGLGNVDNTADANKRVKGANITTTANAVAYYTDTAGTFGSKASANGVLYATAANGTLNWGTLPVAQGGTGATTAANARTNLGLGTAATYTAATSVGNNSSLPTGAAIQTYVTSAINGASNIYVTIATDQTITASQKTFNGAIRWGTASKYGAAHYDSTLEAIVFSFA